MELSLVLSHERQTDINAYMIWAIISFLIYLSYSTKHYNTLFDSRVIRYVYVCMCHPLEGLQNAATKVQGNMTNIEIYMCIFVEFFTIDRELFLVVLNRMKPCV